MTAATSASSSSNAVRIRHRTLGWAWRMWRHRSIPLPSGRCTSRTATSGSVSAIRMTASLQVDASRPPSDRGARRGVRRCRGARSRDRRPGTLGAFVPLFVVGRWGGHQGGYGRAAHSTARGLGREQDSSRDQRPTVGRPSRRILAFWEKEGGVARIGRAAPRKRDRGRAPGAVRFLSLLSTVTISAVQGEWRPEGLRM